MLQAPAIIVQLWVEHPSGEVSLPYPILLPTTEQRSHSSQHVNKWLLCDTWVFGSLAKYEAAFRQEVLSGHQWKACGMCCGPQCTALRIQPVNSCALASLPPALTPQTNLALDCWWHTMAAPLPLSFATMSRRNMLSLCFTSQSSHILSSHVISLGKMLAYSMPATVLAQTPSAIIHSNKFYFPGEMRGNSMGYSPLDWRTLIAKTTSFKN